MNLFSCKHNCVGDLIKHHERLWREGGNKGSDFLVVTYEYFLVPKLKNAFTLSMVKAKG